MSVWNDITDNSHRLAASVGSMINRLGGEEASVVEAILDVTHDPNVMAKQLSEGVGPQSHHELSKVGGYKGELEMDSPVNEAEIAVASP